MAELIIPGFIQKYLNAIHEQGATSALVKLAAEFHSSIDAVHKANAVKHAHADMQQKISGFRPKVDLKADLKAVLDEHKRKAKEIGRMYIKDETELEELAQDDESVATEVSLIKEESLNERKERETKEFLQKLQQKMGINQEDAVEEKGNIVSNNLDLSTEEKKAQQAQDYLIKLQQRNKEDILGRQL